MDVLHATGLHLLPALADMHVHFWIARPRFTSPTARARPQHVGRRIPPVLAQQGRRA
jgi:hypothetical protein